MKKPKRGYKNLNHAGIGDVLLISLDNYRDSRGSFTEVYSKRLYDSLSIVGDYVQDNIVMSYKNALRGLHYQLKHGQGKLVMVVTGEIFHVTVDIRRGSQTFGQWQGFVLSEKNHFQVFVPPGFAHGYLVLEDKTVVLYKCTEYYVPEDEHGILWNDPDIGINWPISDPVLSLKDSMLGYLRDMPQGNLPEI